MRPSLFIQKSSCNLFNIWDLTQVKSAAVLPPPPPLTPLPFLRQALVKLQTLSWNWFHSDGRPCLWSSFLSLVRSWDGRTVPHQAWTRPGSNHQATHSTTASIPYSSKCSYSVLHQAASHCSRNSLMYGSSASPHHIRISAHRLPPKL